jgi:ELWxxDGT repeat protein
MKKTILLMMSVLISSVLFSQKLKWVNSSQSYIDLVDKNQNVYKANSPAGTEDIDPGTGVYHININIEGTYFVKYDSLFTIQWVKTSASPEWSFRNSVMTDNSKGEIFVLTNDVNNDIKNSTNYYITKYMPDGTLINNIKAFYLENGFGGMYNDILDFFADSDSCIWISGVVNGIISFGYTGKNDTISDFMSAFIAKYDQNGNFQKVIKKSPDSFFSPNYNRSNYKLDTTGAIHRIILENSNSYYYMVTDTLGNNTKTKIFDVENGNISPTNLILADSGEFYIAGTFNDAVDFDASSETRYLTPKGSQDVFIAKYNKYAEVVDAWQIGGNGSISTSENIIYKNGFMALTLLCGGNSTIDFLIGPDTLNVELNNQIVNVCYDMAVYVKNDSLIQEEANDDIVADIAKGPLGSYPMYLINFHDTLFFVANDGITGYELWKSDGTQDGTVLVKDLNTAGNSFNPYFSMSSHYPISANDKYIFVTPDTLDNLNTLWKITNDSLNCSLISDSLFTYNKFMLNNKYYVNKENDLFIVTDGTEDGTDYISLGNNFSNLDLNNIVYGNSALFFLTNPYNSTDFYKFEGDNLIKLFTIDKPLYGLEKFKGRFYFYELNTYYDLIPKYLSSVNEDGSDYSVLVNMTANQTRIDQAHFFIRNTGDKLIFTGYDKTNKVELWSTDGTALSAHLIKDLNPLGNLNVNNLVLHTNGVLFFSADIGRGNDVFQTDGTNEGTMRLRGLNPFGKVNYNSMALVNDILFFGATNDNNGCELWKYKLINNISVNDDTLSYSPDSSALMLKLDIDISPNDATDTSITYELIDSLNYKVEIDSLGELVLTSKSNLKSASVNDTIGIRISAIDGSRVSTIYNFISNLSAVKTRFTDLECKIWPNPASDIIFLKSTVSFTASVEIFDVLGRSLLKQSYNSMTNTGIDISALPKGVLFLKLQSKNILKTVELLHQ